jgi:hypothetical protein
MKWRWAVRKTKIVGAIKTDDAAIRIGQLVPYRP